MATALTELSRGNNREAAAIMRCGIASEIVRRQAIAPLLDAATAQIVSAAADRGVDVRAVLTDAIEQACMREVQAGQVA